MAQEGDRRQRSIVEDQPTLLVVEDDPLVRDIAREILESEGYQVLTVQNADEALLLVQAHGEISLVFTDIDMPGRINGLALVHSLRQRTPQIPIIVTSGGGARVESLPAKILYLNKPYGLDGLLEAVRMLLAGAL